MSFICFAWRSWCAAIISNHSYRFSLPRNAWFHLYALRFRFRVSTRKATARSRVRRTSPNISSLLPISSGSCGMGVLNRSNRTSTSHNGRCRRFQRRTGLGGLWRIRSAVRMMARSTITRWAETSAADHSLALGFLLQSSAGIASAAHKNSDCASASFTIMGERFSTASILRTFRWSRHRPAQRRMPIAARALRQMRVQ